jgi:hypothetical protein
MIYDHIITGYHNPRLADPDDYTDPFWVVTIPVDPAPLVVAVHGHGLSEADACEAAEEWKREISPGWADNEQWADMREGMIAYQRKGQVHRIKLPCHGIVITLGPPDPDKPGAFLGAALTSDLTPIGGEPGVWRGAMHAVESLVMAHAAAGVDVQSTAYVEGLETAVEAITNNLT